MDLALVAINGILIFVVGWQAFELRRQTMRDHERRKAQSTIEFYSQLRTSRIELQSMLEDLFGKDDMPQSVGVDLLDKEAAGDPESVALARLLSNYLAGLERLSTGVNSEVFDYAITARLGGGHIVRTYDRYASYIDARRLRTGQTALYLEFQQLANRVRLDRQVDADRRGTLRQ